MTALNIPVVDLSPLRGEAGGASSAALAATARAFGDAFERTGFVTVVNHGVPAELIDRTYRAAQDFFALPMQEKARHTPPEQTKTRGYLPLGIESVAATLSGPTPPDLCEALVFASILRERAGEGRPNYWPAEPAALAPAVNAYFDAMRGLSRDLMRLSALALELPPDWFEPYYRRSAPTLRFVCYPAQPAAPTEGQLRYGAHHDYGGLTILRQDEVAGLQICDLAGRWHDVPPTPGSFVINVGDLMSRWTNDRWRSTLHRVVNPVTEAARRSRRLSMVAFTGPEASARVDCLPSCVTAERPRRYEPVIAQEYVQEKLRASMDLAGA